MFLTMSISRAQVGFKHPIDSVSRACMNDAVTTSDMIGCQADALSAWDEQLNKNYELYKDALYGANKDLLIQSQRKWIEFRDEEFKLIDGHYLDQLQGTMWRSVAVGQKTKIVRSRALQLWDYYEELTFDEDPEP